MKPNRLSSILALSAFDMSAASQKLLLDYSKSSRQATITSKGGKAMERLLRESQPTLTTSRELQEEDMSFLASFSLQYLSCSAHMQYDRDGGASGRSPLYQQSLVRFALCPSDSLCYSSCLEQGGEYVVDMATFVDVYTEAKMPGFEYWCEMIRENCYCGYLDEAIDCEKECLLQAGYDGCIEYEGSAEYTVQPYTNCGALRSSNTSQIVVSPASSASTAATPNANENDDINYFVAPYCADDGMSIHFGVFDDPICTNQIDSAIYTTYNPGQELPFSTRSVLPTGNESECMACHDDDEPSPINSDVDNTNNFLYDPFEVTELCQFSYEGAVRCETNLNITHPDTSGCDYISGLSVDYTRNPGAASGSGVTASRPLVALLLGTFLWLTVISAC